MSAAGNIAKGESFLFARVLDWIVERLEGAASAVDTPIGRLPEPVTARELMTRLGIENRNSIWSALGNLNRARLVYRLTLGWPRETTWAIVRSRINPEA